MRYRGYIRRPRWNERIWRRISPHKWTKKHVWLIAAVIFFFAFVAGQSGFYAQFRLWRQATSLKKAIELEKKKKQWLQSEAQSLKDDMARIEKEVRQEHGMGKPDEVIIKVP